MEVGTGLRQKEFGKGNELAGLKQEIKIWFVRNRNEVNSLPLPTSLAN
jgi:hypothetical protein